WLGTARCARCHAADGTPYARSRLLPLLSALSCAALAAATGPHPALAVWLLLVPFCALLARLRALGVPFLAWGHTAASAELSGTPLPPDALR
ncbi:prepilin peptidase, partial [Streptomyces sp. SID3212]|nr:prepilin peptidase [Streptomyces sp. SID3212]